MLGGMLRTVAASIFASLALVASPSLAQEAQPFPGTPLPPPASAPQPAPYPPPGYYAPPYYLQSVQLGPRVLPWNEGESIPAGYHKGGRPRKGLVIAGSTMLGVAWIPTAIVGTFAGAPAMAVPVIGPFIVAGQNSPDVVDGSAVAIFWLVFDGLQQTAGLAMLIAGFAAPEPVLLRADVKTAKPWWLPVPMPLGPRSAGLGFKGEM
jgi:hypothetical protein